MAIADWVRIMLGKLTPGEVAERDARAQARMAVRQQAAADRAAQDEVWARYQERIRVAGGISHVTVVCHEDTWRFIEGYAAGKVSWRSPGPDRTSKLPNHMLELHLSGMQVALVVYVMAEVCGIDRRAGTAPYVDRPIAARLYDAFGAVIDQVDPAAADRPLPPVVIDDQAAGAPDR